MGCEVLCYHTHKYTSTTDLPVGVEKSYLDRDFPGRGQRLPARALWLFGHPVNGYLVFFSWLSSIEIMPAVLTIGATGVSVPWQPIHAWPALPFQATP